MRKKKIKIIANVAESAESGKELLLPDEEIIPVDIAFINSLCKIKSAMRAGNYFLALCNGAIVMTYAGYAMGTSWMKRNKGEQASENLLSNGNEIRKIIMHWLAKYYPEIGVTGQPRNVKIYKKLLERLGFIIEEDSNARFYIVGHVNLKTEEEIEKAKKGEGLVELKPLVLQKIKEHENRAINNEQPKKKTIDKLKKYTDIVETQFFGRSKALLLKNPNYTTRDVKYSIVFVDENGEIFQNDDYLTEKFSEDEKIELKKIITKWIEERGKIVYNAASRNLRYGLDAEKFFQSMGFDIKRLDFSSEAGLAHIILIQLQNNKN